MGSLLLDITQRVINIKFVGTPGIKIQVQHDGEFSPVVTVKIIDGEGMIAKSTSPFDPVTAKETNAYSVTTWVAVNLTAFKVDKTKVEVSCPGTGKRGSVYKDSHPSTSETLGASWGYNAPGRPDAVYAAVHPVTILLLGLDTDDDLGAYFWGVFPGTPFSWAITDEFAAESVPVMEAPKIYNKKLQHLLTGWPSEETEPGSVTIIPWDRYIIAGTEDGEDEDDAFVCPNGDDPDAHLTIEEGKTNPETPSAGEHWTYTLEKDWNKKPEET